MNIGYENLSVSNPENDVEHNYTSKNLEAERKRRKKLSARLLELRSLVPNITNMNKATIVIDAIAYIEELKECVTDLTNILHEMESPFAEEITTQSAYDFDSRDEKDRWVIEPEVKVAQIDGNKVWMKLVCEKKREGFSKLMKALNFVGYEFVDTSVVTAQGAMLVTASLVQNHGGRIEEEKVKRLLIEIARGI